MNLELNLPLQNGKRAYFASDFHLGIPDYALSRQRERQLVDWLDQIAPDAQYLFLMGDLFDFWFEYKHVVPKGFVRFFGKLAELSDRGVELFFFAGNHDMWVKNYFQQEMGMKVFFNPISVEMAGKKLHIGHGDGLGPGDQSYKLIRVFFRSQICRALFGALHPSWGIGLANNLSQRSKNAQPKKQGDCVFKDKESEWLWQYCSAMEAQIHHDYYIFGHRHLALDLSVSTSSRYLNCGEWMKAKSFVVFDGARAELKTF